MGQGGGKGVLWIWPRQRSSFPVVLTTEALRLKQTEFLFQGQQDSRMLGRCSPQGLGNGMGSLSIGRHITDKTFTSLLILTELLGKFY